MGELIHQKLRNLFCTHTAMYFNSQDTHRAPLRTTVDLDDAPEHDRPGLQLAGPDVQVLRFPHVPESNFTELGTKMTELHWIELLCKLLLAEFGYTPLANEVVERMNNKQRIRHGACYYRGLEDMCEDGGVGDMCQRKDNIYVDDDEYDDDSSFSSFS